MRYLIRMNELDKRGILLNCPKCGRRNRMRYEGLGKVFRCGQCQCELESIGEPVDIHNDLAFEALISHSAVPVLVDFWAPWCGPCKMIAPLLDEIATEKAGSVKVAKVNVDENQSLSVKYNVRAIPALLFFKGGQLRDQVVGMTTRGDLLKRLDALA